MTELKSAERFIEIFNELQWKNATERDNHLSDFISSIQRNAIEAALEYSAFRALIKVQDKSGSYLQRKVFITENKTAEIDSESITSLINHEKLKV